MKDFPHLPVLLEQVIDAFDFKSLRTLVDGTLGAGGHAAALLERYPNIEHYIGIDQDPNALAIAASRLQPWSSKLTMKHGNFAQLPAILKELALEKVDGILVDLGVSSMQLDEANRGFSFMRDGPLDMRMNPHQDLTAMTVVNEWSEQDLGRIIRDYGEEKKWRLAARAIVEGRNNSPIETTLQLANVLKPALGHYSKKGINPLTLTFQAIRICVNRELEVLETFLETGIEKLTPEGRLAVISFHSLEDRCVKTHMRLAASDKWDTVGLGGGIFKDKEPTAKLLTRKPLIATDEEVKANPRSRSAKLRVIEKLM